MSENNFKEKYLKYKNKYLELKKLSGGLINEINPEDLAKEKKLYTVPTKLKEYIKLITIKDSDVKRVGTSAFKIQPYFGDVDILNIIDKDVSTDVLVDSFTNELKQIVSKILEDKNIFYSDFKAANMHWTSSEVVNGVKNGITLTDACKTKGVVKIDIIAPYNQRYVEMSAFFILKSNTGYVNVESDYFQIYKKLLLDDIEKFKDKNPLKAIKRAWSLAKYTHNKKAMNKLKDIIHSNLSLLGQINADLETIKLLIEHDSPYDVNFITTGIDKFKELISTILDIQIDERVVYVMVENILSLIKTPNPSKEKLLEALDTFHDYLLEIINKETKEYIKSIDYHFPTEKIGLLEKIKHVLLD
jgi:hypothetical protein